MKYRITTILILFIVMVAGCNDNSNVADETTVATETMATVTDSVEATTVSEEAEVPEMDREGILSKVYTIPKTDPYSTGYKTIGFIENALANSNFTDGQTPWEINSLDGVVIDNGFIIEGQSADVQEVILAQGIKGFEKMKTYEVEVEGDMTDGVVLTLSLRRLEDNSLIVQSQLEPTEISSMLTFRATFPMNYELPEGVKFELGIESHKDDMVHIKDIRLTRKALELVWSDEFDVDGLPDSEKWGYDVGGSGWGNGERQYYTANDEDNAYIKDGVLNIVAMEEDLPTNPYTSARLVTREKYDTKYKRIEVSARLPEGIGTWPAIWMMPTARLYGPWPGSGEIDIMEHVGYDQNIVHGTIHTTNYNHMKGTQKSGKLYVPDASDNFHTYTVDWTPYEIDFYVDDYLYFTYDNDGSGPASWPYDKDFYLILCLAIGGGWGGQQGIDDTALPGALEVDYVRYYELPVESVDVEAPAAVKTIEVAVNGTLATYEWAPSSDDYMVDHYQVYLDNELIGETVDTDFTIYSLDEVSSYSAGVVAVDESGNLSELFTTAFTTSESSGVDIGETIEGESALVNFGGVVRTEGEITYMENLDTGDYLIYEVDVPKTGEYALTANVSSLMSKGLMGVAVDGQVVIDGVEMPANASWSKFSEVALGSVRLEKGTHFITLSTVANGYTVDYIRLD